jgi:hypothetical protein
MRAVDTDIFNLVSLRGAGGRGPIDPLGESSAGTVAPILRANNIDPLHASREDIARLPAGASLATSALSALVLAKIADALDKNAQADIEALDVIGD